MNIGRPNIITKMVRLKEIKDLQEDKFRKAKIFFSIKEQKIAVSFFMIDSFRFDQYLNYFVIDLILKLHLIKLNNQIPDIWEIRCNHW